MAAALSECLGVYSLEDVVNCEKYLLQKQSYLLNLPTPADFVNILLKLANEEEDMSQLEEFAGQTALNSIKGKI